MLAPDANTSISIVRHLALLGGAFWRWLRNGLCMQCGFGLGRRELGFALWDCSDGGSKRLFG